MKKIIATVLAMVMALALCTTAFAAPTAYSDCYRWNDATNKWESYDISGKTISYTNPTETKKNGEFDSATIGYYTIDGVKFAEVPKGDATYRINADGVTKYLDFANANYDKAYTLKGEAVTDAHGVDGVVACGDVYFANPSAELYVSGDKYYIGVSAVTSSTKYILVDGQVQLVREAVQDTDYWFAGHVWQTIAMNKAADGTISGTAKCGRCNVTGTLTSKKGEIPSTASTEKYVTYKYDKTTGVWSVDSDTFYGKTVYVYWTGKGAPAGSTTTGTASSPKTFDAGIALYAAMALTSVAGSAVVIGKKKEF